jgi:hypothetical protein
MKVFCRVACFFLGHRWRVEHIALRRGRSKTAYGAGRTGRRSPGARESDPGRDGPTGEMASELKEAEQTWGAVTAVAVVGSDASSCWRLGGYSTRAALRIQRPIPAPALGPATGLRVMAAPFTLLVSLKMACLAHLLPRHPAVTADLAQQVHGDILDPSGVGGPLPSRKSAARRDVAGTPEETVQTGSFSSEALDQSRPSWPELRPSDRRGVTAAGAGDPAAELAAAGLVVATRPGGHSDSWASR